MTFRFPFPTLKNLSMLRIGQTTLERRTRPMLKYFRNKESLHDDEYVDIFDIRSLIPNLVQISELHPDLADVFSGMQQQAHDIVGDHATTKAEDVVLIFDVHGRLDVAAVWRCYFDDQLNNAELVIPVVNLLHLALKEQMWCEIEAIIAKIMSLVGLDPHSFPKPKLIPDDNGQYQLTYDLGELSEPSSANVFAPLKKVLRKHDILISRNGDCFRIPISKLCESYVFMREFFITMDTSEKESFIEQVILYLQGSFEPEEFAPEIITDLDDGMLRHFMVKILEGHTFGVGTFVQAVLKDSMLQWPFTQFYIPLLELLAPFLTAYDYAVFFRDIAEQLTEESGFGFVYPDLLLRFCEAIPSNIKQELAVGYKQNMKEHLNHLRYYDYFHLCDRILKILPIQIE